MDIWITGCYRHWQKLYRNIMQWFSCLKNGTVPENRLASILQNKIIKTRMTLNYSWGWFSGTVDMKSKITAGGSARAPVEGMDNHRPCFALPVR